MPLVRKTRVSGTSIVVTIPSQIIEAYNIKNGDLLEIIPSEDETIIIKKANVRPTPEDRP